MTERELLTPQPFDIRTSLLNELGDMPPEDIQTTMFYFDIAEKYHEGQIRATGEPYTIHPYHTVLILRRLGITDPITLGTGATHDVVEDTSILGDDIPDTLPYAEWREQATMKLIEKSFDPRAAKNVMSVTKPRIDEKEINGNDAKRREAYLRILADASPEALLIKMADRLHNLQTLHGFKDDKKAIAVITETQSDAFFKIFLKAISEYPKEGGKLMQEMQEAIAHYERSQNREFPHERVA